MSYSGGPENLTNNHTDEFNYPIYGINAGTSSITFSGDDASSTGSTMANQLLRPFDVRFEHKLRCLWTARVCTDR